jgi:hypothetical protein
MLWVACGPRQGCLKLGYRVGGSGVEVAYPTVQFQGIVKARAGYIIYKKYKDGLTYPRPHRI